MWLQQFRQSLATARESLALYRACADRLGEVAALMALGHCHQFLSERLSALEYYQQSLALARSLGDVHQQALALFHLGDASTVKVLDFWEEAVPLFRLAGDWEMLSGLFNQMASFILLSTGDTDRAQKFVDEADKLDLVTGRFKDTAGWVKGRIALVRGDYAAARAHFLEVAILMDELGLRMSSLWSRAHLGMVALREGSLIEARQILIDTIRNFQEDGNIDGVIYSFEGLAGVFAGMHEPEAAARLIGWADAARARIINPRPFLEQKDVNGSTAASIARIGSAAYQAAYTAGQAMTLDEAVQHASETQAPL
jgi:tetratricopeptide (TPR) repeat protein